MTDPIALRVLTSGGLILEDQAASIIAPGELGYFGVLANHAPLVTTLTAGKLTWRHADGTSQTRPIGEGLCEVAHNRCTILTTDVQPLSPPSP